MDKRKNIALQEAAKIITNGFRLSFPGLPILRRTQGGLL
jgi:hypothetical protein